jgi:midasin
LLIEDLDLAPMEVVSTLLPLVESQQLFIPSRGESLSAAPGFQLFATQRSVSGSSRSSINLLQTHFTVVSLANYTNPELVDIITQRFPTLASTATALVQTFAKLRGGAGSGVDDVLLAHRRHLKALSARDLVRWASRIVE